MEFGFCGGGHRHLVDCGGAAGGILDWRLRARRGTDADAVQAQAEKAGSQKWYCSMHPQIVQDRPGRCPICHMELIPMPEGTATEASPRELMVSESAAKLMDIQTSPVERRFVASEIRMVGKVQYDETRVKQITAWVPGRLDRLYVDFTGTTVRKGDHLVYLYSPELISAQAELLQAARAAQKVGEDTSDYLTKSTATTLDATREKLRLLGLNDQQIEEIERSGRPLTHLTIYSPIGGVVIEKMAREGMYVETGTQIYTVADLSQLWVCSNAYESDLRWIRYGQEVQFTTEAYAGETFSGWISFIDPVLDPMTRTVKVRVDVPNPDGRLRPEMFVRAVIQSRVAQGGKVMDPEMAGKWICPMHPSVVKPQPGQCDICGMDLVTTESLGYVAADAPERAAAGDSRYRAADHGQAGGRVREETRDRGSHLRGPGDRAGVQGRGLLHCRIRPAGGRTGRNERQLQDRLGPANSGQAEHDEPAGRRCASIP